MTEMEAEQLTSSMLETLGKMTVFEVIKTADPTPKFFGRVPSQFRDDWHPFDPKVVSIGPLHMEKPRLERVQKHKWMYMRSLLESTSKDEIAILQLQLEALNPILNKCVSAVRGLEESARRKYYPEEFPQLDNDAFTKMLVLDACFLIELCRYEYDGDDSDESDEQVFHDILLIENQIPFDVLKAVYLSVFPHHKPKELVVRLRKFFFMNEGLYFFERSDYVNLLEFYCENLVHVVRRNPYQHSNMAKLMNYVCKFFLKKLLRDEDDVGLPMVMKTRTAAVMKTSTAAECDKAGIHIKATHRRSRIPHLMFTNGTLAIQRIHMNKLTYSRLRNIILAEEWRPRTSLMWTSLVSGKSKRPMSDYVRILCSLVKSEADYKVLEEKGVVSADSIKDGMLMFEKLKRLKLPKLKRGGNASRIRDSIEKYVAVPHHRWRVNLVRDYFGSPWLVIGLVVGFVLLVLSVLQTLYTLLGYYNNKS